jgi:DNA processing protein
MQAETALLFWWLGILHSRRYSALMEAFGNLDDALKALNPAMLKELGLKEKTIQETFERIETFDPAKAIKDMEERGVKLLSIEDSEYPAALREIGDPPVFLSYIGDLSVLDKPKISVVGTRRMSPYGRRVTEHFVHAFARHGVVTVSGLALGVDAAVAKDSMTAGGQTVAVLGHGLATIYPASNRVLGEKIIKNGGLILSEYPLHHQPDVYTFPARNRIIAGLGLGTLVIEAPKDSGSIITAELALEYNRDVFAVPGQIFDDHMAGCHALIAQGQAKLVTAPEDILREIGVIVDTTHAMRMYMFEPRTPDERTVYAALSGMPLTMDDLTQRTKLDASRIGVALTMMELAGAARNAGGGQWIRR